MLTGPTPTEMTREPHAACGLALPGLVEPVGVAGWLSAASRLTDHSQPLLALIAE